ncbi:MAG TPA: hypothetical protein PLB21_07970 [Actinomycetota bacterium]|nr:hypothetical protein [Actinomycetota bacterium]
MEFRINVEPDGELPMGGRGSVDLYWIPLGAGARSVRFNGIVYEAIAAALQRRSRRGIYHSAVRITLPSGTYMVEMTPIPDAYGNERGVVAEGPVGVPAAQRFRLLRYEIRRWRNGVVPDLDQAVSSPIRVCHDLASAQRIFDLVPGVPRATWGRDELQAGEMWTCNSVISWALATGGIDVGALPLPANGRAPGWDAGDAIAHRPPVLVAA